MRYAYPCRIDCHEGDEFVVGFPDVPEAITGANDRADALELAEDALLAALARMWTAAWPSRRPARSWTARRS
ncbi:MAG: hypothetical protein OXN96_21270 [Bryobacterales bacterium]|nr:hypothetical protein [Bryobacterales bacterium]